MPTWNGICALECTLARIGCARWEVNSAHLERVMRLRIHSGKDWVCQVETDSRNKFGNDGICSSLLGEAWQSIEHQLLLPV